MLQDLILLLLNGIYVIKDIYIYIHIHTFYQTFLGKLHTPKRLDNECSNTPSFAKKDVSLKLVFFIFIFHINIKLFSPLILKL